MSDCPLDMLSAFAEEMLGAQAQVRRGKDGKLTLVVLVRLELPEQGENESPEHYLQKLDTIMSAAIQLRDVEQPVDCPACKLPVLPERLYSYDSGPRVCVACHHDRNVAADERGRAPRLRPH